MATLLDSSSGAEESAMEENSHAHGHHQNTSLHLQKTNRNGGDDDDDGGDSEVEEEGDVEIWGTFSKSFRQVQRILDQNRILIQQVNENHQSKIPENLAKNVSLIREINGNISKVASLYSDLSTSFSSFFHQRRDENKNKNKAESAETVIIDRSNSDDSYGICHMTFRARR